MRQRPAEAGADLLSIESVGGKEVHDDAWMACDAPSAIFGLCVLGERNMRCRQEKIVTIARRHGAIAAGDTAFNFVNAAIVLAEQSIIPRMFAVVDRAVIAVRSLAAYEVGAVCPGKDCSC